MPTLKKGLALFALALDRWYTTTKVADVCSRHFCSQSRLHTNSNLFQSLKLWYYLRAVSVFYTRTRVHHLLIICITLLFALLLPTSNNNQGWVAIIIGFNWNIDHLSAIPLLYLHAIRLDANIWRNQSWCVIHSFKSCLLVIFLRCIVIVIFVRQVKAL